MREYQEWKKEMDSFEGLEKLKEERNEYVRLQEFEYAAAARDKVKRMEMKIEELLPTLLDEENYIINTAFKRIK